ncbi:MAG TPA: glycosyltransferase family 2 protein [Candidatus Binatia bacterium]|jgi:glycosyltransferase involved in cell wall biosynthesis|nr:glycosyltransferase family 2 protein [Candidatus Binatia bacterium]
MSLANISGIGGSATQNVVLAAEPGISAGRAMLCDQAATTSPRVERNVVSEQPVIAEGLKTFSSISVVVPVYNSQSILAALVERLAPVLAHLTDQYELLLINDGSRDQSWLAIEDLSTHHPWVRGINLMRNYGQHNALLCGIRAALGQVIVTMDDDLQHPPEEIPKLLTKLAKGFDVVYGFPEQQQHGLLRDISSELTKLALRSSMGVETARHVSAFRAFRAQARDAFANYHSPFVSIDVVLTWATTRFAAIKVRHDPRAAGASNYTFRKLVTHAMNMMTGFSTLPLQFANLLGLGCTGFGALVLLYVVGRFFLFGTSVPGFSFLASIITIFSGAQLVALGIIGEYLARMHFRMMERPTYVVGQQTPRQVAIDRS